MNYNFREPIQLHVEELSLPGTKKQPKSRELQKTGLLVSCGRSFIVLLATNIFCGESYRQKKEKKEEKEKRKSLKNVNNSLLMR